MVSRVLVLAEALAASSPPSTLSQGVKPMPIRYIYIPGRRTRMHEDKEGRIKESVVFFFFCNWRGGEKSWERPIERDRDAQWMTRKCVWYHNMPGILLATLEQSMLAPTNPYYIVICYATFKKRWVRVMHTCTWWIHTDTYSYAYFALGTNQYVEYVVLCVCDILYHESEFICRFDSVGWGENEQFWMRLCFLLSYNKTSGWLHDLSKAICTHVRTWYASCRHSTQQYTK